MNSYIPIKIFLPKNIVENVCKSVDPHLFKIEKRKHEHVRGFFFLKMQVHTRTNKNMSAPYIHVWASPTRSLNRVSTLFLCQNKKNIQKYPNPSPYFMEALKVSPLGPIS